MNIRKYRAENMKEGLAIIKREMGSDAVILSTQNIVEDDGRSVLEISVAEPKSEPERRRSAIARSDTAVNVPMTGESNPIESLVADLTKRIQSLQGDVRRLSLERELAATPVVPTPIPASTARLRAPRAVPERESRAFRRALDRLERNEHGFAHSVSTMYSTLQSAGVLEEDAEELISATLMGDRSPETKPHRLLRTLEKQMTEHLETGPPIWTQRANEQQIAMLVGPAGVGKTTTVAKIASQAKLVEQRRVGLICVDTYRVAGVYQLLSYAELLGIPMLVADSASSFKAAIADLSDCDLILVDSTGQNPFARQTALGLKPEALVEAVPSLEIHVCMSAVTQTRALTAMLERYADIPPSSLIFCKLDEATGAGALLSAAMSTGLPISHVCNGPNVPGDILCPTASEIARWVRSAPPAESERSREVARDVPELPVPVPATAPSAVPAAAEGGDNWAPHETPTVGSPLAGVLRRTRLDVERTRNEAERSRVENERTRVAGDFRRQSLAREAG